MSFVTIPFSSDVVKFLDDNDIWYLLDDNNNVVVESSDAYTIFLVERFVSSLYS